MSPSGSAVLVGASTAASYNVIFQLAFRILTFGLNAFTLRFVTKDVLGIVNVRLMLIYTTIMVLSQEPFRRASLSKSSDSRLHWRKVVNLFWISFPLVLLLAFGVAAGWAFLLSAPDDAHLIIPPLDSSSSATSFPPATSAYSVAIVAFAASAVIDAVSSPLLVISQAFFFTRLKVGAESIGILAKASTTVILLLRPDCRHLGLHAFSLAQLAFAVVKTAAYYLYFAWIVFAYEVEEERDDQQQRRCPPLDDEGARSEKEDSSVERTKYKLPSDFPFKSFRDFLPSVTVSFRDSSGCSSTTTSTASASCSATTSSSTPTSSSSLRTFPVPLVDATLASLSWTFAKQTLVKQLLTEGERYVMTFFDALSFADQGVFDVVNNLGSLVVRFLFQPIEESANVFFSRTLKRGGGRRGRGGGGGGSGGENVSKEEDEDDSEEERLASTVFRYLLRLVVHLGLLALVFGQSYSHLALHIFGGPTLSIGVGPNLLQAYCLYVLVIAVNGTLEAFVTAVMKEEEVELYSRFMIGFSAAFVAATLALTRFLGSFGFILANCLNMSLRIAYCLKFVVDYYADGGGGIRRADSQSLHTPHPLVGLRVPVPSLIAYSSSLVVTLISEKWVYDSASSLSRVGAHLGVGGVAAIVTLGVVGVAERDMILFAKRNWDERKNK